MQIIVNPEKREWAALTARPQMERSTIGPRVAAILDAVRAEGDDALLRLTRETALAGRHRGRNRRGFAPRPTGT
jgi:histidinol dehydrogenase